MLTIMDGEVIILYWIFDIADCVVEAAMRRKINKT